MPAKGSREKTYPKSLRALHRYFVGKLGDPLVGKIHSGHVMKFLTWRATHRPDGSKRETPLKPRTLIKDRAVLRVAFKQAMLWRWVKVNPVAATEPPKVQKFNPVMLTTDEYERLLSECEHDPMLHLWILLCGETGVRCLSEALWLRWEDVDLVEGFIWVDSGHYGRSTKSGKGRWVPLPSVRIRDSLKAHFAAYRFATYNGQQSPWIFHHTKPRGKGVKGGRVQEYRVCFKRAVARANLPEGFRMHDLRHRRVTTYLEGGNDVIAVQQAMGHADLATTMKYAHMTKEHTRSLMDNAPPKRKMNSA